MGLCSPSLFLLLKIWPLTHRRPSTSGPSRFGGCAPSPIDKEPLVIDGLGLHQPHQLRQERRLRLRLRPQMPQPPQAKPQRMQHLPHAFTAVLHANAGIHEVADQFASPQAHGIDRQARAAADDLLDLYPLRCGQSRWTPWNGPTLPTPEAGRVHEWEGDVLPAEPKNRNDFVRSLQIKAGDSTSVLRWPTPLRSHQRPDEGRLRWVNGERGTSPSAQTLTPAGRYDRVALPV
jgi:hypothetical protein